MARSENGSKSDLIDLELLLIHETDKAILVSDAEQEIWLPKSQVEYEMKIGRLYTITMPEWLAIDKGLV